MRANSSSVSFPGLFSSWFGTTSLPMSCISAANRRRSIRAGMKFISSPMYCGVLGDPLDVAGGVTVLASSARMSIWTVSSCDCLHLHVRGEHLPSDEHRHDDEQHHGWTRAEVQHDRGSSPAPRTAAICSARREAHRDRTPALVRAQTRTPGPGPRATVASTQATTSAARPRARLGMRSDPGLAGTRATIAAPPAGEAAGWPVHRDQRPGPATDLRQVDPTRHRRRASGPSSAAAVAVERDDARRS